VASSRYSAEQGSKRDSGVDQLGTLSDTDSEPRGRKGFRQRFLKKVIPGRTDKDKPKPATAAVVTSAPAAEETAHADSTEPATETSTEPHANPDPQLLAETEPLREKIQEPSTTSAETPALTHTQTDGDEDDFEEARDTFDEQSLASPANASTAKMETPRLVDVGGSANKKTTLPTLPTTTTTTAESPMGRSSMGGGSRFTEEL